MRFKKRFHTEAGLQQIDIAPLIDIVFQLLIFFMLTSSFIVQQGINVKLPRTTGSEEVETGTVTILISSEDIVYYQNQPMTVKQLGKELTRFKSLDSVLIKSDKEASLGIVVKVWDLCKKLKIDKIGIATLYGD